jgi:tetratricopeptide (TPR) repeat protein
LAARPTNDLEAYDAYLRGLDLSHSGNAPATIRLAIAAYDEAISRDSTFALAWAGLGSMYVLMYENALPTRAAADSADLATARALALAPGLPEAYAARTLYYVDVRADNALGLAEADSGLARSPNNPLLLHRAANAEEAIGEWHEALVRVQAAVRLDPRDPSSLGATCEIERWQRMYADAAVSCSGALALRPGNLFNIDGSTMLALARGDLAGARRVIHAAPSTLDQSALVAYFGEYWDLYWALDSAQQARLLTLGPDAFDGDRAVWAIVRAEVSALHGDRARTRPYADSARAAFEAQLVATPNDFQRHLFLGLALAYLGRSSEAVREAERGAALMPIAANARQGPYAQYLLARVHFTAGQSEKALDILEALLKVPFYVSPGWLRIDPTWAALRGNPRFQQLIAGE